MKTPYDIEEIFPEEAGGPVRLPRQQSGNSPQGLAVTLMADYTLSTGADLPSAAMVALLAEAGVSLAGARTAISRLARRGVLDGRKQGRRSSYRLTPKAATFLAIGGQAIVTPAGREPWDGCWTLVAFSFPQQENTRRRGLRGQLRWMGYAPLYDGLWVSPHELPEPAMTQLCRLAAGTITVFRARHVELAATGRSPIDAWDIAEISAEYESFIRRWGLIGSQVRGCRIGGAEAVRARTEVMDTYRRLPILDPRLPAQLLPAGWLRGPARDLFLDIYDGLAEIAQDHVRQVVDEHGGAPQAEVRAHRVADLMRGLSGVRDRVGDDG